MDHPSDTRTLTRPADPAPRTAPGHRYVGARLARFEDERLVRGAGRYVADVAVEGALHAAIVRSPVAHATIRSIDADEARAMPGVVAVLTGEDVAADGIGGIPWEVRPPRPDGTPWGADVEDGDPRAAPPQPILAIGRVRHVGEAVAVVLADTPEAAHDAAGAVVVETDPLPVADTVVRAVVGEAPIWDSFPDNVCFTIRAGAPAACDAAFASAAHVARISLDQARVSPAPIEPRAYLGEWDSTAGRWRLTAPAGKPHLTRATLARFVFRVEPERIHVVVPDIGGGFGGKNVVYPEEALVLWAAKRLGRPVRWIAERSEMIATDMAGREQHNEAELALDAEGNFLALRVRSLVALGAYLAPRGVVPARNQLKTIQGAYHVPAADIEVRGVFTNTGPTCSYRGAGQPEGFYVIERLVDEAARSCGFDPVELRRRNLIRPEMIPYRTVGGLTLDGGDFTGNLEAALAEVDAAAFPVRREESERRGRLRGLGIVNAVEARGFGYGETVSLEVSGDGTIDLLVGSQSSGQSHATVYAQILADGLGIAPETIRVVQGDTDRIATGSGTSASRSLSVGGSATRLAGERLVEVAGERAAAHLEVSRLDLEYEGGVFTVVGTDRRVSLFDLAGPGDPLTAAARFEPQNYTFPAGCHAAEVEVDPATGTVTVLDYVAVQDVGRAVNPSVVESQLHGGIVQGAGQALTEGVAYDADGQLLSATFLDYAMPRADIMPAPRIVIREVPAPSNPLGVKGIGESGATLAPAAIVNAVIDALAPLGVRDLDMPLTPARIWAAIDARKKAPPGD